MVDNVNSYKINYFYVELLVVFVFVVVVVVVNNGGSVDGLFISLSLSVCVCVSSFSIVTRPLLSSRSSPLNSIHDTTASNLPTSYEF